MEVAYLVNEIVHVIIETVYQRLIVSLVGHTWFWMGHTHDIV
jgi:hypothetical protein